MYLINPTLNSNSITDRGMNSLLEDIDEKILCLAKKEYYNTIYGYTQFIDMRLYDKLCNYRDILVSKLLGCGCLDNIFYIDLTYRIKKLLNKFC